jgi:GntR family transcriptional regulator
MSEHMNKMKLKIDHQSQIPLHYQVEELLRQMIELPEYKNGEFLPKEVELAKRLGISRNTIRQATNKLEYEGLLTRKKGVGTKVSQKTVTTNLDSWHSFTQEMSEKGIEFVNFLIEIQRRKVDAKIATFMQIPVGTELLCLTRLRGFEDGPFVYFESYFHPRIGLTGNEDFSRPLYDIVEQDYHVVPELSRENISAKSASVLTAKRLKIRSGDPVLVRERFVFDPGSRPIEYNIGYYIAEKFTYSIDIKR